MTGSSQGGEREPMPEWAFAVVWIGGPFVLGFVLTALTRLRWPRNGPWMALVGVVLGCAYVVWAYYASPRSGAPYDGCSDCEVGAGIGAAAGINAVQGALRKPVPGA